MKDTIMQDELFMRQWNGHHDRFSADLDHGLGQIVSYFTQRREAPRPIDRSYGLLAKFEQPKPAVKPLSSAAQASLHGLAASVITFALWVVVLALATPAPGLA